MQRGGADVQRQQLTGENETVRALNQFTVKARKAKKNTHTTLKLYWRSTPPMSHISILLSYDPAAREKGEKVRPQAEVNPVAG